MWMQCKCVALFMAHIQIAHQISNPKAVRVLWHRHVDDGHAVERRLPIAQFGRRYRYCVMAVLNNGTRALLLQRSCRIILLPLLFCWLLLAAAAPVVALAAAPACCCWRGFCVTSCVPSIESFVSLSSFKIGVCAMRVAIVSDVVFWMTDRNVGSHAPEYMLQAVAEMARSDGDNVCVNVISAS
jgi:hypothetical protein